mgnify:CR=1 FL=1
MTCEHCSAQLLLCCGSCRKGVNLLRKDPCPDCGSTATACWDCRDKAIEELDMIISELRARAERAELNSIEARARAHNYLYIIEEVPSPDEETKARFIALERHLYPWLKK